MNTEISAYIEINLICMAISAILFFLGNRSRTVSFTIERIMSICLWILCIADIMAISFRGQTFEGARALIELSNIIYDLMVVVLPLIWLLFTINRIDMKIKSWQVVLICLPLLASAVLCFTNPITNFLFSINDSNEYVRGDGLFVTWIVMFFYILLSGIFSMVAICKEKNPVKKKDYINLVHLLIIPIVGAIAQSFIYGITTYQIGIALMMVLLTYKDQSDQITRDSLTSISNRNALDGYVKYLIRRNSDEKILVAMIDINSFKNINDEYGHEVGDLALAEAAEVLKESVAKIKEKPFLCRYGGDEFVLLIKNSNESMADEIKDAIIKASARFNGNGSKPYKINFSVGCCLTKISNDGDFIEGLQIADSLMYGAKKSLYQKEQND